MTISLIFIPIILVILLNIPRVSGKIAYFTALAFFAYQVISVFFPFLGSQQFAEFLNKFFTLNVYADGISKVMIISASLVAFASLMTSKTFIKSDSKLFSISNLMLLAMAGINGLVCVQDVFTMYVFIEIIAVSSYIMIALDKKSKALEGGFKYLMMSSIATTMMLFAIALFFLTSGSTSFEAIAKTIHAFGGNSIVLYAVMLFICGLLIKAGLMPFHAWLSGAYAQAPAGVSVFLGGIVTKVTGVFTLIRILYSVTGFSDNIKIVLLAVGALSIVVGALIAITQKDFKRVLAFSSISQVGYIILALGSGTSLGIAAALFHIFNHAIFKAQLFVDSAAVEKQTGRLDLDSFGGLGSKMPITSGTTAIAFLSASGIPPLSGFWSKLLIILALWYSGFQGFAILAVLASLLTMGYFLNFQKKVFFGEPSESIASVTEAPASLIVPAVVLCAITIGIGLFFPYILKSLIFPAVGVGI